MTTCIFSDMKTLGELLADADKHLGIESIGDIRWYAWYHLFCSSSGPHEEEIGKCVMTELRVFGFKNIITNKCIKYCNGVWKNWDGTTNSGW
jgi:hypothetical protein